MKMRLFSLVWGEPYVTWFERALIRSLMWPSNHDAIMRYGVEHNIYTRDGDRERLRAIAERVGIPLQFHPFDMKNSSGETLQPALIDHVRNCFLTGNAAFIAPPDTIFGDGTIDAICKVGEPRGVCVAVPHVRANAGALDKLPEQPLTNAGLVDFAWENLHKTWADANASLQNTNSMTGGVSWRELRKGLYAVSHRLPTCYLANVDKTDVDWFASQFDTGTWDHTWPAKLVKEQRQRTIASSDAAFMVELTREQENIQPCFPADPLEPDKFFRDLEQNYVGRNVVSIFRGASA